MLLQGSARKAYLRKRAEREGHWYAQGDKIEGWAIATVTASNVTFTRGDQNKVIQLYPALP